MDAQKIGSFIAQRRKELEMTQAELAEQLHVTDKAISRWERGIGLPDINILEPLAQKLDVNLVELIQAKRHDTDAVTLEEAENIVCDTIQLSKGNKVPKWLGFISLGISGVITVFLLGLLITDGSVVAYSVGSIVTGLLAWCVPI